MNKDASHRLKKAENQNDKKLGQLKAKTNIKLEDDDDSVLDEEGENYLKEDKDQIMGEVKRDIKKINTQHVVAQQSLLAQSFPGLLSPKHDRAIELQKKDKDASNIKA